LIAILCKREGVGLKGMGGVSFFTRKEGDVAVLFFHEETQENSS